MTADPLRAPPNRSSYPFLWTEIIKTYRLLGLPLERVTLLHEGNQPMAHRTNILGIAASSAGLPHTSDTLPVLSLCDSINLRYIP
jgi:hypothetical protein